VAEPADHLRIVARITQQLRGAGLEPVLVGGMALVVLGSRRVTRDFDFVVADPGLRLDSVVDAFYGQGLELVSRLICSSTFPFRRPTSWHTPRVSRFADSHC